MLDGAPAVAGSTTQQQQPQPPRAATVAPQVIPFSCRIRSRNSECCTLLWS
jgi:hypothetical protein